MGTVREQVCVSPEPSYDFVEGCFSCGGRTHTTDHEIRDAWDDSAAVDCNAVIRINLISCRLCLLPEEVSAGAM